MPGEIMMVDNIAICDPTSHKPPKDESWAMEKVTFMPRPSYIEAFFEKETPSYRNASQDTTGILINIWPEAPTYLNIRW
jgi:hypothetical protein